MRFALQTIPLVAAVSVVVATVLYFVLQAAAGKKRNKLQVTLQDPMVKYGLRLINKQVNCKQTKVKTKISVHYSNQYIYNILRHY